MVAVASRGGDALLRVLICDDHTLVRAGRTPDELRPITIERGWSAQAEGSALISFGGTKVLCTASFTNGVPRWRRRRLESVRRLRRG